MGIYLPFKIITQKLRQENQLNNHTTLLLSPSLFFLSSSLSFPLLSSLIFFLFFDKKKNTFIQLYFSLITNMSQSLDYHIQKKFKKFKKHNIDKKQQLMWLHICSYFQHMHIHAFVILINISIKMISTIFAIKFYYYKLILTQCHFSTH